MFLTVSSREKVLGAPVLIVQQCVDKGGWGECVCVGGVLCQIRLIFKLTSLNHLYDTLDPGGRTRACVTTAIRCKR